MSKTVFAAGLLMLQLVAAAQAQEDCGVPGTIKVKTPDGKDVTTAQTRVFADGSIAVRARLAVNPDGGAASYTEGDHGFTYIANGLNCDGDGCSKQFHDAEKAHFAKGTPELCVYAFEVEPYEAGGALQSCKKDRFIIGNGKGKPKLGAELDTAAGGKIRPYISMTSMKHLVDGKAQYLDSESIPIAVTPNTALLGKAVWVAGDGYRSSWALIGDSGPAFGEGSIALHQLLRQGVVIAQKPGPIPKERRCEASELTLKPPFQSRPDIANDRCRADVKAKGDADIRAYASVSDTLDFVVLGKEPFKRNGSLIQATVTEDALSKAASDAGYTEEILKKKMACLPR